MNRSELKRKIERQVEAKYQYARLTYSSLPPTPPKINFENLHSNTLGFYSPRKGVIYDIDKAILNPEGYLGDTVPHEVAHHIDYVLNGYRQPRSANGRRSAWHGKQFKYIMRNIFNANDKSTSSILNGLTNAPNRHYYVCLACGIEHPLSTYAHRRIENYWCKCQDKFRNKAKLEYRRST